MHRSSLRCRSCSTAACHRAGVLVPIALACVRPAARASLSPQLPLVLDGGDLGVDASSETDFGYARFANPHACAAADPRITCAVWEISKANCTLDCANETLREPRFLSSYLDLHSDVTQILMKSNSDVSASLSAARLSTHERLLAAWVSSSYPCLDG